MENRRLWIVCAALAAFGSQLWVKGWVPLLPGPSAELRQAVPLSFWQMMWIPAAVAWTLAFVALLLGYRRAAQVLAVFALLSEFAHTVARTMDFFSGARPYLVTIWSGLFFNVLIVLAMGAFHRDAPPVRGRPWLVALPVAGLIVLGADYLSGGAGTDRASYAGAAAGVTASLTDPSINTGEAKGDTYNSIENLNGSAFNDTLEANASVTQASRSRRAISLRS